MQKTMWTSAAVLAAAIGLGAISLWATAADSEAAAAANGDDAAASASDGGATAKPAAPVKPRPSEIMPLTASGLLLDVVNTGKHLIAIGDRGAVIVSNNGSDWAQVQTPVRSPLTALSFANENTGWVVGHDAVILKTTDGGKTWLMQNFQPEVEKPFLDVIALDEHTVIAVGAYGLLYRTTDGGDTWSPLEAPSIKADETHFNSITKLGNGALLIVGEQGMLGYSADQGASWEKIAPSPYDGSFYGAIPVGTEGALVFGLRGNAYKTEKLKGGTFTKVDTGTVSSFFGGTALPDGSVVLVGLAGAVLKISPTGERSPLRVKVKGQDALGNNVEKDVTGSFSSATSFAGGILVVGEQGVQSLKL
jgi:photosystem II stability/assembly factor-like uncharacterized protein